MKAAVYVGMCLLLGPLVPLAGVAVSAVFIVVMLVLGVLLLVGRKEHRGDGPQPPPQVVFVMPGMAPWAPPPGPVPTGGGPALHPARRAVGERPPLWAGPGL